MNFKTTYILFGVLFGLVVIFGLVLWLTSPTPPDGGVAQGRFPCGIQGPVSQPRLAVSVKRFLSLTRHSGC